MVTNFPSGVSSYGVPLPTLGGGFNLGSVYRIVNPTTPTSGPLLGAANVYTTISRAITAALPGDVIVIMPGSYNEALTVNKANLTFIGSGTPGAVSIATTGTTVAATITANGCSFINLNFDAVAGAAYSVAITAVTRVKFYGCRFSTNSTALVLANNVTDAVFQDCEFADGVNGIVFATANSARWFIRDCRFRNISTVHITDGAVACTNLNVTDCTFDAAANGTEPTDYLTVDTAASSGIFSGNRFAVATNAAAVLTIGANIQWGPNGTEAGWSTARPA